MEELKSWLRSRHSFGSSRRRSRRKRKLSSSWNRKVSNRLSPFQRPILKAAGKGQTGCGTRSNRVNGTTSYWYVVCALARIKGSHFFPSATPSRSCCRRRAVQVVSSWPGTICSRGDGRKSSLKRHLTRDYFPKTQRCPTNHKKIFCNNLPLRFLSVILKLRAQKLLLEKILAPSLRSAKMSFRCWSTSGPKAKLLTNTMVDSRISERWQRSRKSPWTSLKGEYIFP